MATTKKRKSRYITDAERDYILSLSSEDCLRTSIFMECFGEFNGKKKFIKEGNGMSLTETYYPYYKIEFKFN